MKTDRFSDSIRRKLESIRPDFNEKDWVRMQATLQQATPMPSADGSAVHQPFTGSGSVWSAHPWLMAAAAVSTAVLISVAVWQRSQINTLRSQLSAKQLTQTGQPTPPSTGSDATTASANGHSSPSVEPSTTQAESVARQGKAIPNRADTVFITRYVAVPTPANPSQERVAQRPVNTSNDEIGGRLDRNHLTKGNGQQRSVSQPLNPAEAKDAAIAFSTTEATTDIVNEPSESASRPDRRVNTADRPNTVTDESVKMTPSATGIVTETNSRPVTGSGSARRVNERTTRPFQTSRPTNIAAQGNRSSIIDTYTGSGSTGSISGNAPAEASSYVNNTAGTDAVTSQPAVAYEAVTSRPLTLGTIDWKTPLAYRARRMRPARTTVVGGTATSAAEPASQPVNQVAFGFRLGAGTEVTSKLTSGSLLGELLIGKHVTFSAGLGLASFAGGKFGSDEEFDKHNRQNFRRDYVRGGIDTRNQLLNIGIHTEIVQVPLNVGYRIPLSKSFSVFPSVSTMLNLQSREHVTFEYRPPFYRSSETASYQIIRSIDLLNSLSLGTGLEWNRSHWVAQAGPVVTFSAKSNVNWQDGACVGLRARVFYQF